MRHRIEHRHPESFIERRERGSARAPVQPFELARGDVAEDVDRRAAWAFFHRTPLLGRAEAVGRARKRQTPGIRQPLKGFHQTSNILAPLNRAHEQNQVFASAGRLIRDANAVRNHADPLGRYPKQRLQLPGGEARDGDNRVAQLRRAARLLGEARTKLRR